MSSDTAKENESVVDSSVTENHEDPGCLLQVGGQSYQDLQSEEAKAGNSNGCSENSAENKMVKLYDTRYFIIKSLTHQNIQLSIEKGIWATQVMNEPILEEAFHNSCRVILIFSVNMSGCFQGYAQMMSSVGWRQDDVWNRGNGKNSPLGHSFKVQWLQLNDLPFQRTLHLKNPMNDYKPVKISRDCQEVPQDIGESLCNLLDRKDDVDGMQTSFPRDDLPAKRPCPEPSRSLGDEEYQRPPLQMSLCWTPVPYPSFLYLQQNGASNFHLSQNCSLASTITEDELLEMSYEEYLEAHSKTLKNWCHPVGGSSWTTMPESSSKRRG